MQSVPAQFLFATAALGCLLPAGGADVPPPPEQTQAAKPSAAPWKSLCSGNLGTKEYLLL